MQYERRHFVFGYFRVCLKAYTHIYAYIRITRDLCLLSVCYRFCALVHHLRLLVI